MEAGVEPQVLIDDTQDFLGGDHGAEATEWMDGGQAGVEDEVQGEVADDWEDEEEQAEEDELDGALLAAIERCVSISDATRIKLRMHL